jgi:predicted kinase
VNQLEQDVERVLASLDPLPAPRPRPTLVALSGLPGSGKSTVADALRRRVPIVVLQSDRIRKLLVPVPQYSTEESARVFAALYGALERLLRAGIPALVDATNLQERYRAPLVDIAARTGARFALVWVEASEDAIYRRLTARTTGVRAGYDVSDAGIDVYQMMRARVEPIQGDHIVINTDRDITPAVETLARMIEEDDNPAVTGRRDGQPQLPSPAPQEDASPEGLVREAP